MNAAAAARARRGINRRGHEVQFKRGATSATVKIVGEDWRPEELGPGVTSGKRKIIVSKLDLEEQAFPVPPENGDYVVFGEAYSTIESVDVDRREYQGAYEITVSGD